MELNKRLVMLVACCYLVTACKKDTNSTTESTVADKSTLKSMLVYYEKSNRGVRCYREYLPGDSVELIAEFASVPFDVIWDKGDQFAYFVTADGIFKRNFYGSSDSTQKISDPLPPHSGDLFGQAWFDKATRRLRISYCVGSDVDKTYARKFKELSADTSNKLPDWGTELIAIVAEVDESGKWNPIVEKATKGQAGMTPGFDVVVKYIDKKENTTATSELLGTSTCVDWQTQRSEQVVEVSPPDYEAYYVNKKMPVIQEMTSLFSLKINPKFEILALVAYGDTPHFLPPLYLFDVEKRILNDLTSANLESHSQIGILSTCNYVMLAGEYRHERPSIYEADTFRLIAEFPKATHAIILDVNCDETPKQ